MTKLLTPEQIAEIRARHEYTDIKVTKYNLLLVPKEAHQDRNALLKHEEEQEAWVKSYRTDGKAMLLEQRQCIKELEAKLAAVAEYVDSIDRNTGWISDAKCDLQTILENKS